MNREQRKAIKKIQGEHLKTLGLTDELRPWPREKWPPQMGESNRMNVFVSKRFMVQVFDEGNGMVRLSINRVAFNGESWDADITWEELQQIKNDVGYWHRDAVEIFPADKDVVNLANMRHLWVFPCLLNFAWRR
jgi:hypothetical protein